MQKIQKEILKRIKENGGQISTGYLGSLMNSKVLKGEKTGIDQVKYNLMLLIDNMKVEKYYMDKIDNSNTCPVNSSVRLTFLGEQEFDPWYTKFWRFILYDKHNLFVVFALIVSIISLVASFYALKK